MRLFYSLEISLVKKKGWRQYLGNIIAFTLLTVQTAVVVLTMRYSRIENEQNINPEEPSFAISSAVMSAEIGKCIVGIIVTLYHIHKKLHIEQEYL